MSVISPRLVRQTVIRRPYSIRLFRHRTEVRERLRPKIWRQVLCERLRILSDWMPWATASLMKMIATVLLKTSHTHQPIRCCDCEAVILQYGILGLGQKDRSWTQT